MPLKLWHWADKMAQQVKAFAAKPDDLSFILGAYYKAERENPLQQAVL